MKKKTFDMCEINILVHVLLAFYDVTKSQGPVLDCKNVLCASVRVFPQIALHDQMSNGIIREIYISMPIHWNGAGFRCHLIANSDITMAWLCYDTIFDFNVDGMSNKKRKYIQ